jgi:hypothetical protein
LQSTLADPYYRPHENVEGVNPMPTWLIILIVILVIVAVIALSRGRGF